MFRSLADTTKALIFYGIAFGMAALVALIAPLIGPVAGFVTMFTPAIAVLLMLLVVTIAVSPLALEYLAGETGLFTLIGTTVAAGWLVYRLERRTMRAPSGQAAAAAKA
jgi:hypothetical protein